MGEIEKLPARSEIAEADKWALEDLFLTDADWKAAVKQLEEQLAQLKGYAGKVSASADALYAYLTLADETENLFEKVLVYSNEKMHEDMGNSTYQGYAAAGTDRCDASFRCRGLFRAGAACNGGEQAAGIFKGRSKA